MSRFHPWRLPGVYTLHSGTISPPAIVPLENSGAATFGYPVHSILHFRILVAFTFGERSIHQCRGNGCVFVGQQPGLFNHFQLDHSIALK